MDIVRRETLTPEQAGMPWFEHSDLMVLLYGLRCRRGCVGTFRQPVPREVLRDARVMADIEQTVWEGAYTHVCLRKAVVGDRHWCAICGCFADVVNRRGELRDHLRVVRSEDRWDNATVDVESCPGGSVGRRVA